MIVSSLDQARAALAKDSTAVMESPPGAAGHQGIGWWLALLRLLEADFPGVKIESVLDCADAPGQALAAINAGVPAIRITGLAAEANERLRAIAAQAGTRLVD